MIVLSSTVTVSECRTASDFKCANNMCLPKSVKCDGYDQCGDGSDEAEHCGMFVVFFNSIIIIIIIIITLIEQIDKMQLYKR